MSATDGLEHVVEEESWTVPDTVKLAHIFCQHGVNMVDVSSGGNSAAQTINVFHSQSVYSKVIKAAVGASLLVGCVGNITSGAVAEKCLQENCGDVAFVGRMFLKDPGLVWKFADELGTSVHMPMQFEWPFLGRGSARQAPSDSRMIARESDEREPEDTD